MDIRTAFCRAALALLLVTNGLLYGGSNLCAQERDEAVDRTAGLLAIRALRASLGVPIEPDQVLIGADGRVLRDLEAADLLTTVVPVRCSATENSSIVVIHCQKIEAQEYEREKNHLRLTGGWVGELGREAIAIADHGRVLVFGGGEPILVDVQAIDTAAFLFIVDVDGFTVSGRYPTDEERASGAAWVLLLGGRMRTTLTGRAVIS